MKNVMFFLLFTLVMGNYLFSQQSHLKENNAKMVYPMAIFEPNEPQNVLETGSITKKIKFQLFSDASFKEEFCKKVMTNTMVIACNYDKNFKAGTLVHIDLSPETDFDIFKNILKSSGIQYVSIEDTLLSINNWHPFEQEQLQKIMQINQHLYNLKAKRNWVLEHEEQKKMALENGWMDENTKLIEKATQDKKTLIHEFLKK